MSNKLLTIYADGSCHNAAKAGGWAFLALLSGKPVHAEFSPETIRDVTSNKMEIAAATRALEWAAGLEMSDRWTVQVVSDSQYTVRGASKWMTAWKYGGWVNSEREPVANRLEWKRLDRAQTELKTRADLEWRWVKGHAGSFWNRAVDHLATYNLPAGDKKAVAEAVIAGRIHAGAHPFRE
jgi:ribonuclease HI